MITITNRSSDWGALALNGPRARDILAACTDADLSNAGFKWMTAQEIAVGGHALWAFRMSYAGELGWEFHGPRDAILAAYPCAEGGGQGAWADQLRLVRDERDADGKGVQGRGRTDQRGHAARGRRHALCPARQGFSRQGGDRGDGGETVALDLRLSGNGR